MASNWQQGNCAECRFSSVEPCCEPCLHDAQCLPACCLSGCCRCIVIYAARCSNVVALPKNKIHFKETGQT
ncbi:hypothetical protein BDV06DRAFT_183622 [Aspergillus oleicola]